MIRLYFEIGAHKKERLAQEKGPAMSILRLRKKTYLSFENHPSLNKRKVSK